MQAFALRTSAQKSFLCLYLFLCLSNIFCCEKMNIYKNRTIILDYAEFTPWRPCQIRFILCTLGCCIRSWVQGCFCFAAKAGELFLPLPLHLSDKNWISRIQQIKKIDVVPQLHYLIRDNGSSRSQRAITRIWHIIHEQTTHSHPQNWFSDSLHPPPVQHSASNR